MAGIKWQGKPPQQVFPTIWQKGLLKMLYDINEMAQFNAPYKTGALRASGKVSIDNKGTGYVTFGSERVQYALKRHIGPNRNPATVRYLAKAAETAARQIPNYFK